VIFYRALVQPVDATAIVIGAGHNGLVSAAYLARAGIGTLLLEARQSVGGCASTVSDLGARFNICNCDHTLVRAMPIADELRLADHGLRYLEQDPSFVHLFWDDRDPWLLFPDGARTVDGLGRTRPASARAYERYLAAARPVAELVVELAQMPPTAPRLVAATLRRRARGAATLLRWSRSSALSVLRSFFDDESMIMPALSTGPTVWGVPPSLAGSGMAAAGYAMRHAVRVGRPVGGSGALTDAVASSFEAMGGTVRCNARVERILVENGTARGVVLTTGEELRADVVISACDPRITLVDWLDGLPSGVRASRVGKRWTAAAVYDGYESKIDGVVTELPRYRSLDRIADQLDGLDPLEPTAVVSPTLAQLDEAHALRASGQVHEWPTLLVNLPSVLDPSLAVEGGGHVLSIEALFTPYGLPGGWPGSPEPRRWLDQWSTLVQPGYLDSLRAWRAMTPDRYETEFQMHRGHTPAYAASPLATLVGRQRELSRYDTPVKGLYLTGAGTYPGAGIWGASGRNAALLVASRIR
jgi:phytoene dehydrogenase-like protein